MTFTFNRGKVIDEWTDPEFYDAFNRTYVAGSKTSTIYKQDMYLPVVRSQMNRSDPPLLLNARFMLEARAFIFNRNDFLFEVFDRKLQQYIEADLINYNLRRWKEKTNRKKYEHYQEPYAILTFEELEAGFVVCLIPLVLSIFVFAFERIITLKNLRVR